MEEREKLAAASIGVALLVLGLKAVAYATTGSVAFFSDAIESIINVVTALVAFWAIRLAGRPADAEHPYGHTKAEYFSAVLEGVLIVLAALLIFNESWKTWNAPRQIESASLGLAFSLLATAVNGGWAFVIIRRGRTLRSQALVADGRHLMVDVVSSVGVVAGVLAALWTGIAELDAGVAALVGINILWSGWQVMKESLGGLMDEAVPAATLTRIREIISCNADGAIEAHDLRTRHAGRVVFLDFHLVVPGALSVSDAHDICDRIERALRAEIGDAQVTIHVEPENKAKHAGIVVL